MNSNTMDIGYDDGDVDTNGTASPHLNDLVSERYSRRQTLMGGISAIATAVLGSAALAGCNDDDDDTSHNPDFTVSAASSGQARPGRVVTLTGTVSGGSASNVTWAQTSGTSVTLANATSKVATFIAPAVATPTNFEFRFTAAAANLATASATVSVLVGGAELGFAAVPKGLADVVAVPAGYTVSVLYRLGDPIAPSVPAYANNGTDADFSQRAGDHHDGMSYFGLRGDGDAPDPANSTRGLLVLNHENITQAYLHANGPSSAGGVRPEAEVIKEIEAHGVSVIEVGRGADGMWSYVKGSKFNRRITPNTPIVFSGPARGDGSLRTAYSPDGTAGRGTINNCANGSTPWNSYLTNEENWAGYFRRNAGDAATRAATGRAAHNASLARYGISEGRAGNYGWSTVAPTAAGSTIFQRWNATASAALSGDGVGDFRNEPFQFGWVVEIDPFDPASTPRKRTALGRMNHEGCQIGRTVAGVRPAFYMGDDAQNEYIYKFVSQQPWAAEDASRPDRLAVGDKYLDSGTLYVARFDASGQGQWLPLVFGEGPLTAINGFTSQADVLIHARLAADALGATPMDRPEWTAVNPATGEMYCTLTNNSNRAVVPASTSQRVVDPANPRAYLDPRSDGRTGTRGNANGHVVRLREAGDTSEATSFAWDIYAFGAGSDLDPAGVNLSGLDTTNDFSSPDGLWFGLPSNPSGQITPLMWMQTDDGAFTDQSNCMMLAAIPGIVGDGKAQTVTSTLDGQTATVTTRAGRAPGATLRRFLVGPKECEITGIHSTPDGRSLFVNIQHPGENGNPASMTSNWPASQAAAAPGQRPRSSTVVITRDDGGVVGL
jgi:secreted PhoX family phosphatase